MEDAISSIDRISALPNEVLVHILSLMSTKEAMPTCVLSKRWRSIWQSVPLLKLDSREFVEPWDPSISGFDLLKLSESDSKKFFLQAVCAEKFIQFVNAVLRQRGTNPLDKFELFYNLGLKPGQLAMQWIDHIAVNYKPKVLSLDLLIDDIPNFPGSVFSCASLEELNMNNKFPYSDIIPIKKMHLPCLKKLRLSGAINFYVSAEELFSVCSLLEELLLDCMTDTPFKVSSSTLKHLALINIKQISNIEINAPSLVYLNIMSDGFGDIFLKNLRSLVDARVNMLAKGSFFILKHISALANATTLDLVLPCAGVKEYLEKELSNFPTFANLKKLKVGGWCMVNNFDLVAAFLENTPNLENLTVWHIKSEPKDDRLIQGEIFEGALFLKEYLQRVEVLFEEEKDKLIYEQLVFGDVVRIHPEFEMVEMEKTDDESVNYVLKQLLACVKSVGEIKLIRLKNVPQ